MSAQIPPESARTPLTDIQKKEIGAILQKDGVKFDPKDLTNMSTLQKLLQSQGREDEFAKVMKVIKGFSDESAFSSKSQLPAGTAKKMGLALEKALGKEAASAQMDSFQKYLQQAYPLGTPLPTGMALAKQLEQHLVKQHVPQVEARAISTEAVQGESEGGYGNISSGGAETE